LNRVVILYPELIRFVAGQFRLPLRSPHGPAHWMRVRRNGLELSSLNGANARVVELFSLFHDSCRHNDNRDPEHGPRAALFAQLCFDQGFLACSEDELETLQAACYGHTSERNNPDITIATCWDADRLDLPRVGIIPAPHRLCTEAARDPEMIDSARIRAESWVDRTWYA
jgi:uncharacterized protein